MGRYSHSSLETFRHCPRNYYYRYVARVKLPRPPETVEAFLGSRVHDALEHLYREARDTRVLSADELAAFYGRAWDEGWSDAVVVVAKDRTAADYRAIGERCVRAYHARHRPFDQSRTVGLEQRLTFPLGEDGRHSMVGFVDRLARTPDGTWQIHDYKTVSRAATQAEKDLDPQLALYEIGLRRTWRDVGRVELVWHLLRFDLEIVSTRTPEQLRQLEAGTLATIGDIEARARDEAAFPTHETRLCAWCDFQSVCPVRSHLFATRELPRNVFLEEPGVALVDRWTRIDLEQAGLKAQLAALDDQAARIREALAAYARREGLETVTGSEREATVRATLKTLFPRRGQEPEKAAELEARLRGTPWWDALSGLDRQALGRAWADSAADPDLRRLLEEYVWTEQALEVRLRKPAGR